MLGKNRYSVVAGIFYKEGRVLMGRRHDCEGRFAGYWEFPGGKIEDGESDEEALRREFQEELSCAVHRSEHFQTLEWEYPDRVIELRFYFVDLPDQDWSSTSWPAHSELKWYAVSEAMNECVLPANKKILEDLAKHFQIQI